MGSRTPQDQPDKSRGLGDTLVRREQAPKATVSSPPAVGSGRRVEIRGDTGATVQDASRTSEQTAPNPGTSWRGPLGGGGRPDERSDSERTVTGALVTPWITARECPRRVPNGKLGRRPRTRARRR